MVRYYKRFMLYKAYGNLVRIPGFGTRSTLQTVTNRYASFSPNRWRARQVRDKFAQEAKMQGFKSRAAFKLLEVNHLATIVSKPVANIISNTKQIHQKHKIFRKGQTIVDLVVFPAPATIIF